MNKALVEYYSWNNNGDWTLVLAPTKKRAAELVGVTARYIGQHWHELEGEEYEHLAARLPEGVYDQLTARKEIEASIKCVLSAYMREWADALSTVANDLALEPLYNMRTKASHFEWLCGRLKQERAHLNRLRKTNPVISSEQITAI